MATMSATTTTLEPVQLRKVKLGDHMVYLEDLGPNQGKVMVTAGDGDSWSYYWGAMGGDLQDFLCHINSDYFADKLMGSRRTHCMDVKKTFTEVRRYIREELGVTWLKHKEFAQDVAQCLRSYQDVCEENPTAEYFVDHFRRSFASQVDYTLLRTQHDMASMEREIGEIQEVWNFIQERPSEEYLRLKRLHKELVRVLSKGKRKPTAQVEEPAASVAVKEELEGLPY